MNYVNKEFSVSMLKVKWRDELGSLQSLWRYEKNPTRKRRLLALILLQCGFSQDEVQAFVEIPPVELQQLISQYQRRGITRALGYVSGSSAKLTLKQQMDLAAYAERCGFKSVEHAAIWIETQYRVKYSYEGVKRLLQVLSLPV